MLRNATNPIPNSRKAQPRGCGAGRTAVHSETQATNAKRFAQSMNSQRDANATSQTLGVAVDPPLTIKINEMLDEVFSRLLSAQNSLDSVSYRLFADQNDTLSDGVEPVAQDFATAMSMRLHHLIGVAGNLTSSANRLNNRL